MSEQASKVACPNCGTSVLWSQDFPYRPFCSERCKMVDLGAWFTEERSIPVDDPGNFSTSSEDS